MKLLNRNGVLHRARASAVFCLLVSIVACSQSTDESDPNFARRTDSSIELFDGRVIPAMPELLSVREQYDMRVRWLEKKHAALLPMMRKHDIGMWIIINEEFHDDPVTPYIAPKQYFTGRLDVHIFVDAGAEGLERFTNLRRPNLEHVKFFDPMPISRNNRGFEVRRRVSRPSTSSTNPAPSD